MSIAEDIKEKRQRLGLSQKDFSDALGLGKFGDRTLRRWENGESSPSPLVYKAIIVSEHLNLNESNILGILILRQLK